MIRYKNILLQLLALLLIVGLILSFPIDANAQKKAKSRLKVYYEKLENSDKKLSIILTQGSGKKIKGIKDAAILLLTYNLDEEVELASLTTDANGEADLYIQADYSFPQDEEGFTVINASYIGNDSIKSAKKRIKFKDLDLDISFEMVDSVKVLTLSTFKIDSVGNKIPIEDIEINIGVKRLFSTLFLEKTETNENGKGTLEFPNDIPGDSIGIINVVALITDDDTYGTITKSATVNWGVPVDYFEKSNGRSLFGDEAPLWMIISVFIILVGAWYHFVLAILRLIKIKKLSPNRLKNMDASTE